MADRTRLLYGLFLLVSINALYLWTGTSPAAALPSLIQYLAVTAGGILLVGAGTERVVTLVGDRASPRQYVGTAWLALGLGFLAPAVGDLLAGDGLTLRVGGAALAGGAALLVGVSTLVAPEPATRDDD
ncbi:hypothetical protein [Salinirubrum litoreum]|uniref:SPW repeat-containing protein n=1 Tax=Salinirubrum litoreum TaxID=1126234 RepID=A0ABD5RD57_9EURY|nr:hypothetical protein [Salinirubrum litoreum]